MKRVASIAGLIFCLLILPWMFDHSRVSVDGLSAATGSSSGNRKKKPATPNPDEAKAEKPSDEEETEEKENPEEGEEGEEGKPAKDKKPAPEGEEEPTEEPAPPPPPPEPAPDQKSSAPKTILMCSKCGFTTDVAGNCPKCNEPLSPF
jgi:outer membrane biosynthesis protein TonB